MDKHGNLPANDPVWVELEGVLTATEVVPRAVEYEVGVRCDDVLLTGEPLEVGITAESDLAMLVELRDDTGAVIATPVAVDQGDDHYAARVDALAPGRYTLRVGVRGTSDIVTTPIAVADVAEE